MSVRFENHPELNEFQRAWVLENLETKKSSIGMTLWALLVGFLALFAGYYLWQSTTPEVSEWPVQLQRLASYSVGLAILVRILLTMLVSFSLLVMMIALKTASDAIRLKNLVADHNKSAFAHLGIPEEPQRQKSQGKEIIGILAINNPRKTWGAFFWREFGTVSEIAMISGLIVSGHPVWATIYLCSWLVCYPLIWGTRGSCINFIKQLDEKTANRFFGGAEETDPANDLQPHELN